MSAHSRPRRSPLYAPLMLLAASQITLAAPAVFSAIATPRDAPLVFGPQVIGGVVVGSAVAVFAKNLTVSGQQNESLGRLRPFSLAVIGFVIWTIGWAFDIVSERDSRWEYLVAACCVTLAFAFEASALCWAARRLKGAGDAPDQRLGRPADAETQTRVERSIASSSIAQRLNTGLVDAVARTTSWIVGAIVFCLAIAAFVEHSSVTESILGGILIIASIAIFRGLLVNRRGGS